MMIIWYCSYENYLRVPCLLSDRINDNYLKTILEYKGKNSGKQVFLCYFSPLLTKGNRHCFLWSFPNHSFDPISVVYNIAKMK